MIREFHDEITRLRAELEKYGGSNINKNPNQATEIGPDGELIIEEVEYVDNT